VPSRSEEKARFVTSIRIGCIALLGSFIIYFLIEFSPRLPDSLPVFLTHRKFLCIRSNELTQDSNPDTKLVVNICPFPRELSDNASGYDFR